MVTFGVDAHKRTHTNVAVDDHGKPLGQTTIGTTSMDHLGLVRWARRFGAERSWAVEDCRQLSRRLERDLLGAGEVIERVPPQLMAHVRDSARLHKSDPIDARSRWFGRRSVSLTYRRPGWTGLSGNCGYSLTTANPLWQNELG